MDIATKAKVKLLKHYLSNLPHSLPPLTEHSSLNQLDIRRYLDILADKTSGPGPVQAAGPASIGMPTSMVDKSCHASTVAPEASAWDT